MAYLKQRDLAEDATQEIFLAAFQSRRKLQETNRFQAWLKRMSINRCLDGLRRRRKYLVSSIDEFREKDLFQSAHLNTPEDDGSMKQEFMVSTGLFLLESPEKKVLNWYHLHGLGLPLIAATLAMSVTAAKKRLERSRKALREEMTKTDAKLAIGNGFSPKKSST
jgi:RNA polymerase sigma-70 factor (ECF subfamily)